MQTHTPPDARIKLTGNLSVIFQTAHQFPFLPDLQYVTCFFLLLFRPCAGIKRILCVKEFLSRQSNRNQLKRRESCVCWNDKSNSKCFPVLSCVTSSYDTFFPEIPLKLYPLNSREVWLRIATKGADLKWRMSTIKKSCVLVYSMVLCAIKACETDKKH